MALVRDALMDYSPQAQLRSTTWPDSAYRSLALAVCSVWLVGPFRNGIFAGNALRLQFASAAGWLLGRAESKYQVACLRSA